MLEAYPKPGPTGGDAMLGPFTTTTLPDTVLAEPVDEGLEAKLEHPGAEGLEQTHSGG